MAAHRMSNTGWFDTPLNPAFGLAIFLIGFVSLVAVALAVTAFAYFL